MDTCGVQQELQIKIGESCKRKDVLVFNRQAGEKPEKIQYESVTYRYSDIVVFQSVIDCTIGFFPSRHLRKIKMLIEYSSQKKKYRISSESRMVNPSKLAGQDLT